MTKRPTQNQARQVSTLLAKHGPAIEAAFKEAIRTARGRVVYGDLIAALNANNLEAAAQLLKLDSIALFPLEEAIRSAYLASAGTVVASLPAVLHGKFGFNGRHVRAENYLRTIGAELIQGITDDSLAMARKVIIDGMSNGGTPQTVARELMGRVIGGKRVGGLFGLTTEQAGYVINARRLLSDPATMSEYYIKDAVTGKLKPRYRLSDRKFDARIQKAMREGRKLTTAELDQITDAHKSKSLTARGKLISERETFSAQSAGREEAYKQVLSREDVEDVTVRWQHNLSQNPREDHVAMSGTVISLTKGEKFNFADASMERPHDPAGGIKHSAGCRCIGVYRIVVAKE